jgi:hypothetical protein
LRTPFGYDDQWAFAQAAHPLKKWALRLRESSMINQRMYQNVVALGIAGFALFLTTSAL